MTTEVPRDAAATRQVRRQRWTLLDARLAPFVLLLPFMAIFLVFRVWPLIQAVAFSFQDVQGIQGNDWVGLENYERVFNAPQFTTAMANTFVYTIVTLIILIPIPLALSALLDRGRTYRPMVWRSPCSCPRLPHSSSCPSSSGSILSEDGLMNKALMSLGLSPQAWLTSASLAIPSLLIVATWRWVGVNMLYFNSGLVNISRDLYEAAAIDGASGPQMFRHITVPLMRPTILFVLIISVIGGFQLFVEPLLMWSGGNSPANSGLSVALLIYRTAFTSFRFGDAAAMGVVLAFIILIVSLVVFRLAGIEGPPMIDRWTTTQKDQAAKVPVGSNRAWSRLATLLLFLVLAVVFLIPLYWMVVSSFRPQSELFTDLTDLAPTNLTVDNYVRLFQEQPYARWFFNSVVQSLGFAALSVAVCTMAGYALAKYKFRGNNVLFFGYSSPR